MSNGSGILGKPTTKTVVHTGPARNTNIDKKLAVFFPPKSDLNTKAVVSQFCWEIVLLENCTTRHIVATMSPYNSWLN